MRRLFLSLLLLSACSSEPTSTTKITDPLVIDLLVFGEVVNLNMQQDGVKKHLQVKLHKTPSKAANDCFPESHGICAYNYYVTTSQLDDAPIYNAYFLGTFGDLTEAGWEQTQSEEEKAIINFQGSKYPSLALEYNTKLENEKTLYQLIATPNDISFKRRSEENNIIDMNDIKSIAQLTLDLDELNPYFHTDVFPERSPLKVLESRDFRLEKTALEKFGVPVLYLKKGEQDLSEKPYFEFNNISVKGRDAIVDFSYPVEGLVGSVAFMKNNNGEWQVTSLEFVEN